MRKYNRGFTLIELIIVISIFTIIIGIGYSTFNKVMISMKDSQITMDSQSSVNIINKYITKDLERSNPNGFVEPTDNEISSGEYSYILKVNGLSEAGYSIGYVKYIVNIEDAKYSITRKTYLNESDMNNNSSVSEIKLISNQFLGRNNQPFIINKSNENNNIYNVSIEYKDKSTKVYTFDVSYRYNEYISSGSDDAPDGSPERPLPPPEIPEIDDELQGSGGINGFIKFGYKDGKKFTTIGSSRPTNGNNYTQYGGYYGTDDKTQYSIQGNLNFNNNSGQASTKLDQNNAYVNDNSQSKEDFGSLSVNQVNVTILGDVKLILNISQKHANKINGDLGQDSNKYTILYKNVELDKVGKYTFPVDPNGKDIVITGDIEKLQGSKYGEVIITFGTKK